MSELRLIARVEEEITEVIASETSNFADRLMFELVGESFTSLEKTLQTTQNQ